MLKEGDIAIWQNINHPGGAYLNGMECTVLRGLHYVDAISLATGRKKKHLCYLTDTESPLKQLYPDAPPMCAAPHQLRPKFPPKDEIDITEESPIVEHA